MMNVNQLSPNGYHLTNILDNALYTELLELVETFVPEKVWQVGNSTSQTAIRESYKLTGPLRNKLLSHLSKLDILQNQNSVGAIELWRDYPGYYQTLHQDNAIVKNIMVIYLDGNNNINMGTVYYENDIEYAVPYNRNSSIYLLNSDKILHGLNGTVSDVDYRRTIYINWINDKT
jgi:hypothetical protein